MATLLKVDLDQLHKLAGTLGTAELHVKRIKVADAAQGIDAALPGSGLDTVCTQAGQFVDGAYQRVAGKFHQVADAVEVAANTYQETDTALANEMRKFDIRRPGN
ncbi:hypothetical protein ACIP5Y_00235 [Nocardia sp. NPDC088792]|uniref:hypothetical protein n=1 Tax=Nocardia sp. NPDC088792 TaxID=3364332 RepID=UPI00382DDA3C